MSDKWIATPYGNAVVDGSPRSEWSWCVQRDDDSESIEVESEERAEEIAALMNLPWRDGLAEAAKVAHDERARRRTLEEALRAVLRAAHGTDSEADLLRGECSDETHQIIRTALASANAQSEPQRD